MCFSNNNAFILLQIFFFEGGDLKASFHCILSKVHLSINVYRVYLSLDLCRNIVIIGRYIKEVATYMIQ